MPRKAEVVKAIPRAGTIIAWAAWLPSIAGLADLVRAQFISPLTAEVVYPGICPGIFTNLNPLTRTCSNAVIPSFLFQTQNSSVTLDAKLKAQRILYAIRSGVAPESDGELYQASEASRYAQQRIGTLC